LVVFLTSLRHPNSSNDYSQVLALFEKTARSVCAQNNPNFRFVVVCNEVPDISYEDDRIYYHKVDFPAAAFQPGDIPADQLPYGATSDWVKRDKGSKLLSGLLYAKRLDSKYIYIVDADDWVNTNIVDFLLDSTESDVLCANTGYLVNNVTRRMKKRYGIIRYCGSTFAYKTSYLLSLTEFKNDINENSLQNELIQGTSKYYVYEVCGDHSNTYEHSKQHGATLQDFPFPAVSWVVETGENVSHSSGGALGIPINEERISAFGLPESMLNLEKATFLVRLYEFMSGARSAFTWWLTKVSGKKFY